MNEQLQKVFETKYSENSLTDFLLKTEKIYDFFEYDFILNEKDKISQNFLGGKIWLNDDYKNIPISNIEIISLELVYPILISQISITNLDNFNEIYLKLISIYRKYKNESLKKYINMVYGCLQNPNSMIYSNNMYKVSNHLHIILNKIITEFKGHLIYVDTYVLYFRNFDEISERFFKYFNSINKYELTLLSEKSKFGFFMGKKRYMIEEHNGLKIKGLNHLNKDGICKGGFINF